MEIILTIFSTQPYLVLMDDLPSWVGFAILTGSIFITLWKTWQLNQKFSTRSALLFVILLLFAAVTNLFIGAYLPVGKALVQPGIGAEPIPPLMMFFSDIPWLLAAGTLGPIYTVIIGLVSGLIRSYFYTHHLFSALITSILAIFVSICLRQNYRTSLYQWLRHPSIAILPAGLIFSGLFILTTSLTVSGELVSRIDYSISAFPGFFVARMSELLIASIIGEAVRSLFPSAWISSKKLQPSPAERSLQTRFLINMSPLALAFIIALMAGTWFQAGRVARNMLRDQMASIAQVNADQIPLFLETSQHALLSMATDTKLQSSDQNLIQTTLAGYSKDFPFFDHLILINENAEVIAKYHDVPDKQPGFGSEEQASIQLALNHNIPFDDIPIIFGENRQAAWISFIAPLKSNSQLKRILVARADLLTNPFTSTILSSFDSFSEEDGGYGMILDERNRILVHPDVTQILKIHDGSVSDAGIFSERVSPVGTRQYEYTLPVRGRPWSIVLIAPATRVQSIALEIAGPQLLLILLLALIGIFVTRAGLSVVTGSLKTLANQAGRIAEGRLDHPLTSLGDDEVGQLRHAFEQMRLSLKSRLDELNRLLIVSQGVASSLDISEAVKPILDAALVSGASVSRVVLLPAVVPEVDGSEGEPVQFSSGFEKDAYHDWDAQVLTFSRQQDRLVLSNTNRPRLFQFNLQGPHPKAIIAFALRHESQYYGVFWVGYNQPHTFSVDEVQFLTTLSSHAALAAANARLFLNAEIGRQRLAAILASSPDPILVTDQQNCLQLSNPAAIQVLGMGLDNNVGKPVNQVISQAELVELLQSSTSERQSTEILLPDQRVYLATATPVLAEGLKVGRVCVLRDVTHFKQVDSLKTDFVATVSHDLRSPLTMMRGYATMLDGLGNLNEQQSEYVSKILEAVEDMTRLINNLLDLGRIEAGVGLQLETVTAKEIVDHVVNVLHLQAAQKRIQIQVDIPDQNMPSFEADRAMLQQALRNLVDNAIKYSRVEGLVKIKTQVGNLGVIFQISDHGTGISPMDLPRLFEKFYRGAQQGVKDSRGTGLGLAIVKSIAEQHGGHAWAESELGKGSDFFIAIPLRQPKNA